MEKQFSPPVSIKDCKGRWSTLVRRTPAPLVFVLTKVFAPTRAVISLDWDMDLEVGKAVLQQIPEKLGWLDSLTKFCTMVQMLEEKITESQIRCRLMFVRNLGF